MEPTLIFKTIAAWFVNLPWQSIFSSVRFFFLILNVIFTLGFFYVLAKAVKFRPVFSIHYEKKRKPQEQKKVNREKQWAAIQSRAAANQPQSLRLAVIEADTFVDRTLQELGFAGEHMADRLERFEKGDVKSLERVWRAHRLRSDLVHTPEVTLRETEAKQALDSYEDFLKEIGVL